MQAGESVAMGGGGSMLAFSSKQNSPFSRGISLLFARSAWREQRGMHHAELKHRAKGHIHMASCDVGAEN